MAITTDDFNKIWASTSPLTPYSFSASQYKEGWNFIGSTPPSRQMWDFLQKNNDEKMQYLFNNYLPLSGGTITGGLTVEGTITGNLAGYVKIQNNAGFHNSIFRGKNLGTSLTAAQSAAIQAGTFDDMFIGDYWAIGGYNWRIGMFDPWYNVGDTNFATHHLGIIPDTILYNALYNSTNTTEGGYVGSALYSGIGTARTTVKNAFGAAHVPTHKVLLPTTCTGGKYTSWAWRDEDIMLMTEVMVYGARVWGSNGYSVASQDCQWPLFALSPQHRHTRQSYWLQDVASESWFARVDAGGRADVYSASSSIGVRPAFALI